MARKLIEREWDEAAQAIVASFPDGEKLTFSYRDLPEQSRLDCGMHGMEQKIFDSISGEIAKGTSWTDIRAELNRVHGALMAGEWTGKRGSSEGPGLTLLCEGVARAWGVDSAKVQAALKAMTPEQRKALGDAPEIKTAIAEAKLERAKANQAKAPQVDLTAIKAMFA